MLFAAKLQNSSGGMLGHNKMTWNLSKVNCGEKKMFLTPHFGLLQQERDLTSHFLPIKEIIVGNFILTHKLCGSFVLSFSSWTKVVIGASEEVHETFSD